ncbi:TolC family protein [Iodobacter sp. CM08]|uniref:TolC family protein n=1 Tax=Iodobacter sp. CM08 TaxID=3085902 RepID=UPI00298146B2|nr:TolC family protein [Iodobacter sp. CM08]MDW5419065.1 TolC family protein [Iodobacter sp. CM08]
MFKKIPLLLMIALAGCAAVGPNYQGPADSKIDTNNAQGAFISSDNEQPLPKNWWQLYREPALNKLLEDAFAANTDLRQAAANLARSRALVGEAQSLQSPNISMNAAPGYGRASGAAKGSPKALEDDFSYDTGVNLAYQFDLVGKISRGIEASQADSEAAKAAYDLVRVSVAGETTRAFADICSFGKQLQVAGQSVNLQQQSLGLDEKLFKAGRGTSLDVVRSRGQLAQLQAALPPLEAQRRIAMYRLAVLTGHVPEAIEKALPPSVLQCNTTPQLASSTIPSGKGSDLLRRRPDIRQAERGLAAATARIGVVTADLYPTISIGLSGGSTGLLDQFGDNNTMRWGIGPLISWTIPSTGAVRARINAATAGAEGALAKFDSTVLTALREVESALTLYARELDRNAALVKARGASTEAASQAQQLYKAGKTTFLTVLDANRSLASAESALASSNAALASNQIAVFMALGGGWEE